MTFLETIVEAEGWRRAIADVEAFAEKVHAAARAREPKLAGPAALLLGDDQAVRTLNARFRKQDKPTNVLSFPSGAAAPEFLGDVALALETCLAEAAERGLKPADHAAHLMVHGLLHLVGYDHESDEDAAQMERLETLILDDLGVCDPYASEEITG